MELVIILREVCEETSTRMEGRDFLDRSQEDPKNPPQMAAQQKSRICERCSGVKEKRSGMGNKKMIL